MIDIIKIQDIFDWSSGIISAISFFASLIVIKVFYLKRLQNSLTNQFVMQLIISEMINNLNHVSPIINYFVGRKEVKYYERRRVCFTQIYAGLFTNFYTLFSSFLISFRIYDLLVNNSMTFRKPKNVTRAKVFSFYICALISYIIWFLQIEIFQNYTGSGKYFRVLTCWVDFELDCASLGIFAIFIILTCIYCIKSRSFVQSYQKRLYEEDDLTINDSTSEQSLKEIQKIKVVQKRLVLYPIVTTILFSLIIVYRILSYLRGESKTVAIVCLALYSLTSVLRGIIFIIIYFGTQQVFRDGLYELFTCKNWKEKKIIIPEKLNLEEIY